MSFLKEGIAGSKVQRRRLDIQKEYPERCEDSSQHAESLGWGYLRMKQSSRWQI